MSHRIRRVLVANRGEIARRVMRTCRQMGLGTVAVYSDPDRHSPHVADADTAVALGGSTPTESYLDIDKVIRAARLTGADTVHPGYGFLAENADFAAACGAAGLVWVGPSPEAIRSMARKVEAKELAAGAGVPLLPGATITGDDADDWSAAAEGVGYPLLVKASAGGGGKGMHRVDAAGQLADAVRSARREAASAFGDPAVFLERLVDQPRHVEVQVLGDTHGGLVHLAERDCSVQRRHQKVIEEAPAPGLSDGLRDRLHHSALAVARAIGYTNAGTVEFLVSGDELWFLEVNTRLQVEHPVTEEICGLDLVRLQLLIAGGAPLPFTQDQVRVGGHAIEARLYAEDPAADFLPSIGTIHRFEPDPADEVRWDAGVVSGSEVSSYYDPMLAKVIAHGADREEAAARLARGLRRLRVHGVTTNRDSLVAVLESDDFLAGRVHTGFFEQHPEVLAARPPDEVRRVHAVAAALVLRERRRNRSPLPRVAPAGWRNMPGSPAVQSFTVAGAPPGAGTVGVAAAGVDGGGPLAGAEATVVAAAGSAGGGGGSGPPEGDPGVVAVAYGPPGPAGLPVWADGMALGCVTVAVDDHGADLEVNGIRHRAEVSSHDDRHWVNGDGWQSELLEMPRFPVAGASTAEHGPTAPVPGTIVLVEAVTGAHVAAGDLLVVLEAMKMEHRILAGAAGVVTRVLVAPGDRVDAHQLLVEIEPAEVAAEP